MESRFRYYGKDGLTRTAIVDSEQPNVLHVKTELQMDEIIASIERDRDNIRPGSMNKLVARVPMTIYEQAFHEQWDEAKWKDWLNDPDNKAFRIWPGRV